MYSRNSNTFLRSHSIQLFIDQSIRNFILTINLMVIFTIHYLDVQIQIILLVKNSVISLKFKDFYPIN